MILSSSSSEKINLLPENANVHKTIQRIFENKMKTVKDKYPK